VTPLTRMPVPVDASRRMAVGYGGLVVLALVSLYYAKRKVEDRRRVDIEEYRTAERLEWQKMIDGERLAASTSRNPVANKSKEVQKNP